MVASSPSPWKITGYQSDWSPSSFNAPSPLSGKESHAARTSALSMSKSAEKRKAADTSPSQPRKKLATEDNYNVVSLDFV